MTKYIRATVAKLSLLMGLYCLAASNNLVSAQSTIKEYTPGQKVKFSPAGSTPASSFSGTTYAPTPRDGKPMVDTTQSPYNSSTSLNTIETGTVTGSDQSGSKGLSGLSGQKGTGSIVRGVKNESHSASVLNPVGNQFLNGFQPGSGFQNGSSAGTQFGTTAPMNYVRKPDGTYRASAASAGDSTRGQQSGAPAPKVELNPYVTADPSGTKSTPAKTKKEEWILGILHRSSGQYLYYITDDAIKLVNTKNGGIVVAKAPTWRVSCFRPSEKLEYSSDLQHFDKSSISSLIPGRTEAPPVIHPKYADGVEELRGMPCKRATLGAGNVFLVAADIKPGPHITEIIARYFGTQDLGAVTVNEIRPPKKKKKHQGPTSKENSEKSHSNDGVPWAAFSTYTETDNPLQVTLTSWKKVPFNAADFEYPKNYKQTKDLQQVIISNSNRAQIVDLIQDITLGKDGPPGPQAPQHH